MDKSFRSADRKNYDEMTGEEIVMPQKDFDFTYEQAEGKAKEFLSELGIEGMEVVESEKIYYLQGSYNSEIDYGGYLMTFIVITSYSIHYTKLYDDLVGRSRHSR